jgi:hypothetical protein
MHNRISTATAVGLVLLGLGGSASADEKMIGSLAAVDAAANTLSVQETGAAQPTQFTVDDKTLIRLGKDDVELAALEAGRTVKVTYVQEGGISRASRVDVAIPLATP